MVHIEISRCFAPTKMFSLYQCFQFLTVSIALCLSWTAPNNDALKFDMLSPYVDRHGSMLSHEAIIECQTKLHGTAPHEVFPAHKPKNALESEVKLKRFIKQIGERWVRGHFAIVNDPSKMISVLEPGQKNGCNISRTQTVVETAKQKSCIVATNAGFFNTKTGACLGNVISDGRLAFDSGGIQNAHFGLKKDGTIFTGYLAEDEVKKDPGDFLQLVGGVIWLLRNNSGYVNISKTLECEKAQETGSMDFFVGVQSARTAIGHDNEGNVILVHVDGKSSLDGISLTDFQTLLKEFGIRNAINLDGGGSSTFLVNGTVVNYPYDSCPDGVFNCDRNVSTVICLHAPKCEPENCSDHGTCVNGQCSCHEGWLHPNCGHLICSQNNCSNNGVCTHNGCVCKTGFYGPSCNKSCSENWIESECHSVAGACHCLPEFNTPLSNGSCDIQINSSLYSVGDCLAKAMFKEQSSSERSAWYHVVIILSVITAVSFFTALVALFYSRACCRCVRRRKIQASYLNLLALSDSEDESFPTRTSYTQPQNRT